MQSYAKSLTGEWDSQFFLNRQHYTAPKRSGVYYVAEKPTNAKAIGEGRPNDDGE